MRETALTETYSGLFLVVERLVVVNLVLQRSQQSNRFITHVDKVKRCFSDTPASWLGSESPLADAAAEPVDGVTIRDEDGGAEGLAEEATGVPQNEERSAGAGVLDAGAWNETTESGTKDPRVGGRPPSVGRPGQGGVERRPRAKSDRKSDALEGRPRRIIRRPACYEDQLDAGSGMSGFGLGCAFYAWEPVGG